MFSYAINPERAKTEGKSNLQHPDRGGCDDKRPAEDRRGYSSAPLETFFSITSSDYKTSALILALKQNLKLSHYAEGFGRGRTTAGQVEGRIKNWI